MQIYQVQQVTVLKKSESPLELVISAQGLVATSGWTNPRLDDSTDPKPGDAVLDFSFDADRPQGFALQVLTPVAATVIVRPAHGADAVIVSARTNKITVHVSEFEEMPTGGSKPGPITTRAIGEEMHPTTFPGLEEQLTTFMVGEELPSTLRLGEEGPWTDPRVDDPFDVMRSGVFGEDPGPFRRGGAIDPVGPLGRF